MSGSGREGRGLEPRSRAADAREAIRQAGLTYAPREVRQAFWIQYNRRRRERTAAVGQIVAQRWATELGSTLQRQARAAEILERELPKELFEELTLGPIRRGVLQLFVSSSSLAFQLRRDLAPALVRLFERESADWRIREVRIQVGSPATGGTA